MSLWHTGGVASAVAQVRASNSLLVVYCAHVGSAEQAATDDGRALEALSQTSTAALERGTFASPAVRGAMERHGAVCVRLRASAEDADYANFAALFEVGHTPCVHVVAPDGRVLVAREFHTSPGALVRALDYAAAVRDGGEPAQPDLGPALHAPRPLPAHVVESLRAERAAAETAARKAEQAAKRKAAEAAKRQADDAPKRKAEPAAGTTGTARTTAAGVMERTGTLTRSLPESRGALQLGARARLQVRLPGGGVATRTFEHKAALQDVADWACEECGVRAGGLQLSVTFPRRVFDAADMGKTVEELGLTPTATLMSTLVAGNVGTGTSAAGGVVSAGGAFLRGAVGVAGSFFGSLVGVTPGGADAPARNEEDERREQQRENASR